MRRLGRRRRGAGAQRGDQQLPAAERRHDPRATLDGEPVALNATGVQVGRVADCSHGFHADAAVRFTGAQVGVLNFSGAGWPVTDARSSRSGCRRGS